MSFKGQAYLLHFCLPHFFFHCTTAYNIARHNGVEIGKRDYMGTLNPGASSLSRAAAERTMRPVP